MKTILKTFMIFLEAAADARAASVLTRLGKHEEARQLILGNKKS